MIFIFCMYQHISHVYAADTVWKIQSIDTMKLSRDKVQDKTVAIPLWVKKVADLHANYIAIDTPYNEEFYPVLQQWVTQARKNNLHVWFRGNFSEWEGWFNYPKMKNPNDDHALIKNFIFQHPHLFEDGDIFTPVPEAENGVIGDPRSSSEAAIQFNQFLVTSYVNCSQSFAAINKHVGCGYFSMNGDVANMVLTQSTLQQIGNVIVIDHYVDSPEKMGQEIDYLHTKFPTAIIVLGEFGAPIPTINPDMTDIEQATFVDELLQQMYAHRSIVMGSNYWTLSGGSTALFYDDLTPHLTTEVIKKYYLPNVWKGKIIDAFNDPISYADITVNSTDPISSKDGVYSIVTTKHDMVITIHVSGYQQKVQEISFMNGRIVNQSIILTPTKPDFWNLLQLFLKSLFL